MDSIALNADYKYADQLETTIKSIFFHNKNVNIHVINYDIPHEWCENLDQYAREMGSRIIDQKVDPSIFNDLSIESNYISKINYGKFLIPRLIDADKVLYLDSDIIVEDNLSDLFRSDLGNHLLAAVKDYNECEKFNAGVLLINNKLWREKKIGDQLFNKAKEQANTQLVINDFFDNQIKEMDLTYNYQIGYEFSAYWYRKMSGSTALSLFDQVQKPKIIHYTTSDKPFNVVSVGSLRNKWWYYHNLRWEEIIDHNSYFNEKKLNSNFFKKEAFIFTRVAEIQNLEPLIKALPEVHFNIAAYTNMAWLLVGLSKYDNVSLYPNVVANTLHDLVKKADIYLDINYGNKEENIINMMIHRQKPIFSFKNTHSQNVNYDQYYIFENNEIGEMANRIRTFRNKRQEPKHLFNIKVKDINDSLNTILANHYSVSRFGDGEITLIEGRDLVFQKASDELSKRLKKILLRGSHDKTLVCVPDVFANLDQYDLDTRNFYEIEFFPRNYDFLKKLENKHQEYGSTFLSRPYMNRRDKSKSGEYFNKLKRIWNGRNLLIVEGRYSCSGVGNDLFVNANSIKRIICPPKNAYEKIEQIEATIREKASNCLVLLMVGPTSEVIIDDLQDLDNQLIDLGHIDSEYEWFKMGAKYKVKLKGKHTAEFSSDKNITIQDNPEYKKEIVAEIK